MPLSPERKTWYFERLQSLIENHTKIFLVQVRSEEYESVGVLLWWFFFLWRIFVPDVLVMISSGTSSIYKCTCNLRRPHFLFCVPLIR